MNEFDAVIRITKSNSTSIIKTNFNVKLSQIQLLTLLIFQKTQEEILFFIVNNSSFSNMAAFTEFINYSNSITSIFKIIKEVKKASTADSEKRKTNPDLPEISDIDLLKNAFKASIAKKDDRFKFKIQNKEKVKMDLVQGINTWVLNSSQQNFTVVKLLAPKVSSYDILKIADRVNTQTKNKFKLKEDLDLIFKANFKHPDSTSFKPQVAIPYNQEDDKKLTKDIIFIDKALYSLLIKTQNGDSIYVKAAETGTENSTLIKNDLKQYAINGKVEILGFDFHKRFKFQLKEPVKLYVAPKHINRSVCFDQLEYYVAGVEAFKIDGNVDVKPTIQMGRGLELLGDVASSVVTCVVSQASVVSSVVTSVACPPSSPSTPVASTDSSTPITINPTLTTNPSSSPSHSSTSNPPSTNITCSCGNYFNPQDDCYKKFDFTNSTNIICPHLKFGPKKITRHYCRQDSDNGISILSYYYYVGPDNKILNKAYKSDAQKIKRMWHEKGLVPFFYVEGHHPIALKDFNHLRLSDIFMRINYDYDKTSQFSKESLFWLSEDPGITEFMVSTQIGTGSAYYFSSCLSDKIKSDKKWIARLESRRAKLLNTCPKIVAASKRLVDKRTQVFGPEYPTLKGLADIKLLEVDLERLKKLELLDENGQHFEEFKDFTKLIDKSWLRIKNEVDHAHQIYSDFSMHFDIVLSPKFGTAMKNMVKKGADLSKVSKAVGSLMAHARARKKLKHNLALRGHQIIAVHESNDTKTCSECFNEHHPGKSKEYHCCNWKCKFKGYRDESSVTTSKRTVTRLLEYRRELDLIHVAGSEAAAASGSGKGKLMI
jgi:hypothetical protein